MTDFTGNYYPSVTWNTAGNTCQPYYWVTITPAEIQEITIEVNGKIVKITGQNVSVKVEDKP